MKREMMSILFFRKVVLSLLGLGTLATVATVTVVGGGGLLLVSSPLLLLFSPILVPAAIIFTLVAGSILN